VQLPAEPNWKAKLRALTVGHSHHYTHQHVLSMAAVLSAVGLTHMHLDLGPLPQVAFMHINVRGFSFNSHPSGAVVGIISQQAVRLEK
jgi:hypothetical protein